MLSTLEFIPEIQIQEQEADALDSPPSSFHLFLIASARCQYLGPAPAIIMPSLHSLCGEDRDKMHRIINFSLKDPVSDLSFSSSMFAGALRIPRVNTISILEFCINRF